MQTADANKTYNELYLALEAYKQQMDYEAESYYGEANNFNGFFIRENVPCDFIDSNAANVVTSTYKKT